MSWTKRYKIYTTRNPNLIITAVCSFPNFNDTIERVNEYYKIAELEKDVEYRNLYAYYNLKHSGCNFIPIAFSDRVPKLDKLAKISSLGKGWFWCVGYISEYFVTDSAAILKSYYSTKTPPFEKLLFWLKYHNDNYSDSVHSSINIGLFKDALRNYVYKNTPENLNTHRRFDLIENCDCSLLSNTELTVTDWIKHLENLKNRDIYEIIVNEFK